MRAREEAARRTVMVNLPQLRLPAFRRPSFAFLDRLPDMVAFNERVHARVDPLFERRPVRFASYVLRALLLVFAVGWL